MKSVSTIMALWKEGYFSEAEVIAWADAQILKSENDPADSLIELSLKGPSYCTKLASYVFPAARRFNFSERFAIKLELLSWDSEESVMKFINWASRSAMGEDLAIPEVLFGYCLDDYFGYDEGCPLKFFNEEIELLKPKSKEVFERIIAELNA